MAKVTKINKQFDTIVPSPCLKCAGVHKLKDSVKCSRFYFFRWVLNLESKNLNLSFFYGTLVHKGVELFSLGYSRKKIEAGIVKEARKYLKRYPAPGVSSEEIMMQIEIAKITIDVYVQLKERPENVDEVGGVEVPFQIQLKSVPLFLNGTIDGFNAYGLSNGSIMMREIKTASQIPSSYFQKLKFDKQVYTYANGIRMIAGKAPSRCEYLVFRKPSIGVKKTESVDEFLIRYRKDLFKREDFYFISHVMRLSKTARRTVMQDIEQVAFDLYTKYEYLGPKKVLIPENWARNEDVCFNYGMCQFYILCSHPNTWYLFTRLFQMREIRYAAEMEELSKGPVSHGQAKGNLRTPKRIMYQDRSPASRDRAKRRRHFSVR